MRIRVSFRSRTRGHVCSKVNSRSRVRRAARGVRRIEADYSCNPDYNVFQLGFVTRWTPVKNLTFSAEVQWFHLDQKFSGASLMTTIQPKPNITAVPGYEFKDQDTVALNVRVQRNF
jgi:hypothetical protein